MMLIFSHRWTSWQVICEFAFEDLTPSDKKRAKRLKSVLDGAVSLAGKQHALPEPPKLRREFATISDMIRSVGAQGFDTSEAEAAFKLITACSETKEGKCPEILCVFLSVQ